MLYLKASIKHHLTVSPLQFPRAKKSSRLSHGHVKGHLLFNQVII
jgi:hypothetical protein